MFSKSKSFEQYAPIAFGLITFCIIAYFRSAIAPKFGPDKWDAGSLYSAVFNWSSIQSGFVFGIYGFLVTKKDGFAGVVAKTSSFNLFLTYARRAYLTGFVLTFVSLPIMVVNPSITNANSAAFWIVAIWFSTFIWVFCAFLRVAFIFGMISATPDKKAEIIG